MGDIGKSLRKEAVGELVVGEPQMGEGTAIVVVEAEGQ